jgi:hypothetical protein
MRARLATLILAISVMAMPAAAADGAMVVRKGACNGPSTWKLVGRRLDATTLNVRVEIVGGAAGQTWSMVVTDNLTSIIRTTKVSGPGGFVRWVRKTQDRPGPDLFEMAGYNRDTGESCRGSLLFSA